MSATPSWFGIAVVLFFAMDAVVVMLVLIAVRRKNRDRGFEVIMKPESEELPEARKE